MSTLKRWVARFSFSCLILGGLCGWTSYQTVQTEGWGAKPILLIAAAVLLGIIGMIGVRFRHQILLEDDRRY